jgi:hypothetical protein
VSQGDARLSTLVKLPQSGASSDACFRASYARKESLGALVPSAASSAVLSRSSDSVNGLGPIQDDIYFFMVAARVVDRNDLLLALLSRRVATSACNAGRNRAGSSYPGLNNHGRDRCPSCCSICFALDAQSRILSSQRCASALRPAKRARSARLRHTRIFAVALAYFACSSSPSARRRVMRPPALHCSLFVVVRIRSSQADLTAFLRRPSVV